MRLVPAAGIEPATLGLQNRCATVAPRWQNRVRQCITLDARMRSRPGRGRLLIRAHRAPWPRAWRASRHQSCQRRCAFRSRPDGEPASLLLDIRAVRGECERREGRDPSPENGRLNSEVRRNDHNFETAFACVVRESFDNAIGTHPRRGENHVDTRLAHGSSRRIGIAGGIEDDRAAFVMFGQAGRHR